MKRGLYQEKRVCTITAILGTFTVLFCEGQTIEKVKKYSF